MRKAGSIIVDRLRERVLLGRYFGCWAPGDRLPSVREVARLEAVDRKTAAAAYRHLEREGLVRVEARSGVYLRPDGRDDGRDPLGRLHRQWLEHTLESAAELGLRSDAVARLLQGVSRVEGRRIPVVDPDVEHANLLARELTRRTALEFGPCRPDQLPAVTGPLRGAPFLVATPAAVAALPPGQRELPCVSATLDPGLLGAVRRAAADGVVSVVVATDGLASELSRAVQHGLVAPADRVRVVRASHRRDGQAVRWPGGPDGRLSGRVVVWPGAPPWVAETAADGVVDMSGDSLLSSRTVGAIRRQVARSATETVSRSNAAGWT